MQESITNTNGNIKMSLGAVLAKIDKHTQMQFTMWWIFMNNHKGEDLLKYAQVANVYLKWSNIMKFIHVH